MESFEYTPLNQSRPGIAQAQLERPTAVATSLNSSVSAVQQMQGRLAPHQMTPPSTLQHHSASQQIQGHFTLQQMATTPVLQQRSTPLVLQGLLSEPVAGEEGLQSSSVPPALPAASFTARLFDIDSSDESDTTPIATPSAEVASTRPEDRFDTMKADEIRKECTRRGLKVKSTAKKHERVAILRRHDVAKLVYGGLMTGKSKENAAATNTWSKHFR
ncbi:hypothetical protein GN244_ATG20217 [Phytophthora infestans]|uniref:Uncharacterized protein n=1 Tax=Phytophthora infestans TaxID=4787 RepID=A0A833SDI8_PHYIN|nr:hypothetical protein GN244_ATG20217 [Phytophthora infestans]